MGSEAGDVGRWEETGGDAVGQTQDRRKPKLGTQPNLYKRKQVLSGRGWISTQKQLHVVFLWYDYFLKFTQIQYKEK